MYIATVAAQHGDVVYIDTGGAFSAQRAKDYTKRTDPLGLKLRAITVHQVFEIKECLVLIESLLCSQSDSHLRLLVLDSIGTLLSPILGPNQLLAYAQMGSLVAGLSKLARQTGVPIVVGFY